MTSTLAMARVSHSACAAQEAVAQYGELAGELARLLPGEDDAPRKRGGGALDALPAALGNLHDLLLGAAARLEALHERVAVAKDAFLEQRRAVRRGPLSSGELSVLAGR